MGKLLGLWLSESLGSVDSFPDLISFVLDSKSNPSRIPSLSSSHKIISSTSNVIGRVLITRLNDESILTHPVVLFTILTKTSVICDSQCNFEESFSGVLKGKVIGLLSCASSSDKWKETVKSFTDWLSPRIEGFNTSKFDSSITTLPLLASPSKSSSQKT